MNHSDPKPTVTILDLDGSLTVQPQTLARGATGVLPMAHWGSRLRLGCSWRVYRSFSRDVDEALSSRGIAGPAIVLYGSGDFHHVTLSLLMRRKTPCNLLVLDKHPDWMRYVPVIHCGSWLNHAARLPQVHRVYHVGGDMDFDNRYRVMAPRDLLLAGRIRVFSAVRSFQGGLWSKIAAQPVRASSAVPASTERICSLFRPLAGELAEHPLYISIDKDVLAASDACTNWDAGCLTTGEVLAIVSTFLELAGGRLAGADVLGDWSEIRTSGWISSLLAFLHGGRPATDPVAAARVNQAVNLRLLEVLQGAGCRKGVG